MITITEYIQWYGERKKEMIASGRYASEPTFLFKQVDEEDPTEWIFNLDNWNGGDILRHFFRDDYSKLSDELPYEIKYYVYEGQTTIFIFTPKDWYEISWYKSRGRTDIVKKNGERIYLDEYIELCNLLNVTLK